MAHTAAQHPGSPDGPTPPRISGGHLSAELHNEVEHFTRRLRRTVWLKLRAAQVVLVASAVLFVATVHYDQRVTSFLRGETDLFGNLRFLPTHPPDPRVLSHINFKLVHEKLLPEWVAAEGSAGMYRDPYQAEAAFQALLAEVGRDPNLDALLQELRLRLVTRQFIDRAERIKYLLWAWNDYLQRNGQRFWVRGTAHRSTYNAFFSLKTYDLLARPQVQVAGQQYRISLVTRIDRRDVREPYLGAASKNENTAFVVVDRLHDFVIDHLWPVLDGEAGALRDPVDAAFAEAVVFEALVHLDEASLRPVATTAHHRRAMARAIDGINRRQSCSGSYVAGSIPLAGLEADVLEQVQDIAERSWLDACPAVTLVEAEVFASSTRALATTEDLAEALGTLAAWLAQGVTVHEVRHMADSDLADGLDQPLPCARCPASMDTEVRAEVSAYLSTLAWSGSPATALFQACHSVRDDDGAHGRALNFLLAQLDVSCTRSPPPFLADRARALERELFERSQPVRLGADFPQRVLLP
ncbi:MAG: hypothetical protein ABIJ09_09590 [Pseudomonadota bacterium]